MPVLAMPAQLTARAERATPPLRWPCLGGAFEGGPPAACESKRRGRCHPTTAARLNLRLSAAPVRPALAAPNPPAAPDAAIPTPPVLPARLGLVVQPVPISADLKRALQVGIPSRPLAPPGHPAPSACTTEKPTCFAGSPRVRRPRAAYCSSRKTLHPPGMDVRKPGIPRPALQSPVRSLLVLAFSRRFSRQRRIHWRNVRSCQRRWRAG